MKTLREFSLLRFHRAAYNSTSIKPRDAPRCSVDQECSRTGPLVRVFPAPRAALPSPDCLYIKRTDRSDLDLRQQLRTSLNQVSVSRS